LISVHDDNIIFVILSCVCLFNKKEKRNGDRARKEKTSRQRVLKYRQAKIELREKKKERQAQTDR